MGIVTIGAMLVRPASAGMIQPFVESYLKTAAGFLAQVFGSLLGLIVGYYFGRRSRD
jgi:hypothetical protein